MASRYNEPMKKKDRKRPARIDNLEQMIPYLFALGCARAWMTLTFAAPAGTVPGGGPDPHMLFDYAYAAFGIAATVFARHFVPLHCRPWAKPGALVAMIAASLCIIAAPHAPDAAVVLSGASALLGAFGFCAVLLMFNEAIVPLSLVRIALYTAASRFIAVPLTYLCQGLSGDRMALVLVLSLIHISEPTRPY